MITVGIVGCGGHANTHAATIRDSSFAVLAACADIDPVRAEQFARTYGIANSYGSLKDMATGHKLDLLIIVAFPTVHPVLIREAIEYGIRHILCEKPLALNSEQARQIMELAESSGTLVVEGLMYRSHPQIARAKALLASGAIGDIRYIHAQFSDYASDNPGNWRNNRSQGGGSMTAKGCYLVDACNLFSGSRAKAAFCIESTNPDINVEVGETGTILYENGVTAQFETNHRSVWREEIKVCGTKGTLLIPHLIVTKTQKREIVLEMDGAYESRPMRSETFSFDVMSSYGLQLDNLYCCITEGAAPHFPVKDSVANYIVTDALMRSVASGKLEPVHWGD
ncbi:Gfo/Idh/MocA family protein [Paenibacillus abyssi]|uniref:Deoxyfructose oxidoreductase n=1 Tax=Paenibacillus abyssi TaxID=1340531 RepID=A0A917CZ15_9BACL|nr:Gfo/Idh/MocA family oxidoreductase [Paenibacillus abyssi]GGG02330.1 deoxyfructose oxidoreductase [Paenibacillus abyssi]